MSKPKKRRILHIELPKEYASALRRYLFGRTLPEGEALRLYGNMEYSYRRWQRYMTKHDHLLNVEWEENQIEKRYRSNMWYNAHRRLKRYEKEIEEAHRNMFRILLTADGNWESFDPHNTTEAEAIYADFMHKYGHQIFPVK